MMSIFTSITSSLLIHKGESLNSGPSLGFASSNSLRARYPKTTLYEGFKRGVDIFAASLLLTAVSPLMLVVGISVRISSKGSAIFFQKRLTKNGRLFDMYKFRSMVVDAEVKSGPVYAINSDPRVTRLGKFLRISRLDELPQLINVLIGDMSLIGPRPERPEMAQELSVDLPSFHRRLEVKAGLTGLAQIQGGYASDVQSYRKKLALDLLYIKKRSILLDLKIAVRTILVILTGFGAR